MKNQSVSDFVATEMDAVLNSKEHKSLFATQYKKAAAHCSKCGKDQESCMCDSAMADDADEKDSSMAWDADENDARKAKKKEKEEEDAAAADDDDKDSSAADDDEDDASDGSSDMKSSAAFEVAIDSLLTASAALDSLGLDRGSVFTLKIASLVVEAKKKDEKKKKDSKNKGKFPFQKGKSDSHSAKDSGKKSTPKKDDKKSPKKSDSKSTSSSSSKKK